MRKYIVGNAEEAVSATEYVIVAADSEAEALERFRAVKVVRDPAFLDYVYGEFSENLMPEPEGGFSPYRNVEVSYEDVKREVYNFFGDRTDFAQIYMDFLNSERSEEIPTDQFNTEMLQFISQHTDWMRVAIVPLEDLEQID